MDWPISGRVGGRRGHYTENVDPPRKLGGAGLRTHDGKAAGRPREARHRVLVRRSARRRREIPRSQEMIRNQTEPTPRCKGKDLQRGAALSPRSISIPERLQVDPEHSLSARSFYRKSNSSAKGNSAKPRCNGLNRPQEHY